MCKSQGTTKNNDVEGVNNKKPETIIEDNNLKEVGGPLGLEPTRYGDWERKGRCVDF